LIVDCTVVFLILSAPSTFQIEIFTFGNKQVEPFPALPYWNFSLIKAYSLKESLTIP